MSKTNDTNDTANRYLKNTVDEMLAEQGMDPELALVTNVDYVDGELQVEATERPDGTTDAAIAEAKAVAQWYEEQDDNAPHAFVEVAHGNARAAVYYADDHGCPMVETEMGGKAVGEPQEVDDHMGRLVSAAMWTDPSDD